MLPQVISGSFEQHFSLISAVGLHGSINQTEPISFFF